MKILKPRPKPNPDQPKIFSCLRCGCEFEADVGEYTSSNGYSALSFYALVAELWFVKIFFVITNLIIMKDKQGEETDESHKTRFAFGIRLA